MSNSPLSSLPSVDRVLQQQASALLVALPEEAIEAMAVAARP